MRRSGLLRKRKSEEEWQQRSRTRSHSIGLRACAHLNPLLLQQHKNNKNMSSQAQHVPLLSPSSCQFGHAFMVVVVDPCHAWHRALWDCLEALRDRLGGCVQRVRLCNQITEGETVSYTHLRAHETEADL
eukprot:1972004-Amphidinium_carterae.1